MPKYLVFTSSAARWSERPRVRDGVLLALERPGHQSDDMLWAFIASSERQGLFELRIGDVVEVNFDEPFADSRRYALPIPHRVARADYGSYRFCTAAGDAIEEALSVLGDQR